MPNVNLCKEPEKLTFDFAIHAALDTLTVLLQGFVDNILVLFTKSLCLEVYFVLGKERKR